jgi:DUF1680 family protein
MTVTRRDLIRSALGVVPATLVPVLAAGAQQAADGPAADDAVGDGTAVAKRLPSRATPLPLTAVRLTPSRYLDAVEANRRYVLALEPDRLLHDYRAGAGLPPKAPCYGGWEQDTIAGHTLGHYLSALALLHEQTGDTDAPRRAAYVVDELRAAQAAHGDGYVAGFKRKRLDGTVVYGKELFPELMRGDIRALPFDLNGCWVPLYNWHKLFNGLRDVEAACGIGAAREVATGLAGYVARVVDALDDAQLQRVLDCEHGGINESFADLYARTGERRWLALAERLYHRRVLEPLAARRDELAHLHANTQIPKLIGLARLHELTGRPDHGTAAAFFWDTVTANHTYVIGGNADREYFQAPRSTARYVTEQTCEGCNTYNMLKLTRHVYSWRPDATAFDFYERAHLNHVLAQQEPATGAFTYMTPLLSGAAREHSEPHDSFWCCVGSGMESHAKHGDSAWWESGDTLFVNLYVPSIAEWRAAGARLALTTRYPYEGTVRIAVESLETPREFALALRIPAWCSGASVRVSEQPVRPEREAGYAVVRRRWRAGDVVLLELPVGPRLEAAPGDERTVALLHGPLVLAADLGAADRPYAAPVAPALVGRDLLAGIVPVSATRAEYRTVGLGRPGDLRLVPFHDQHRRRSAVYFRRFDDAEWRAEQRAAAEREARARELDARSLAVVVLGDDASERAHDLASSISYAVVYRGRPGRDARTGGHVALRLRAEPVALVLRATYWGEERNRRFHLIVDGRRLASERLDGDRGAEFVDVEYAVPPDPAGRRDSMAVRIEPEPGFTAGPLFGLRVLRAAPTIA